MIHTGGNSRLDRQKYNRNKLIIHAYVPIPDNVVEAWRESNHEQIKRKINSNLVWESFIDTE